MTSSDTKQHILDALFDVIEQRRGDDPASSWTAKLLSSAPELPVKN